MSVLHTSALIAYGNGSVFMGALVSVAGANRRELLIPAACLAEAYARVKPADRHRLDYLARALFPADVATGERMSVVVPLAEAEWRGAAAGIERGLDLATAHAVLIAFERETMLIADHTAATAARAAAPGITVRVLP